MSRVVHAAAASSSSATTASSATTHVLVDKQRASSTSSQSVSWWKWAWSWRFPSPCRIFSCFFPTAYSPLELLEYGVLYPLETYESLVILPVGFVRRHMPIVGGTLVVLMTLHGIFLRLFLDVVRTIFARITYSRDVRFNYRTFWTAMRDRYAFFSLCETDWHAVHKVFGEPLATTTSEDDLWIALQESVALCGDQALRVTRPAIASIGPHNTGPMTLTAFGKAPLTSQRFKYETAVMDVMQRRHLTDGGRQIANHFVYGILNAETSPGWRIGYLSINAMDGFVDFPLPRLDALAPVWSQQANTKTTTTTMAAATATATIKSVAVPEIYDLESMRWALEAVLRSLGDVDALILDLRFNRGGGSLVSALSVASFFSGPKKSVAFLTDEKVPGSNPLRFTKKRKHYVPRGTRALRYNGPLVVLQSQYTRGTAEILALSLMNRPDTCRIGAPSAGSLTQTRKLRLPNHWTVDIPYMRCFSASGALYEGRGVPVDKPVEKMEDTLFRTRASAAAAHASASSTSHASAVAAARDLFDPCIKTAIEHIMNV